jgi:hypothetical protein
VELKLTDATSEKLQRFLKLTLDGSDVGLSGTTENSESSESSENSESSEDTESSETTEDAEASLFIEKINAVNPAPDEWGDLISAAEAILSSRLARP